MHRVNPALIAALVTSRGEACKKQVVKQPWTSQAKFCLGRKFWTKLTSFVPSKGIAGPRSSDVFKQALAQMLDPGHIAARLG